MITKQSGSLRLDTSRRMFTISYYQDIRLHIIVNLLLFITQITGGLLLKKLKSESIPRTSNKYSSKTSTHIFFTHFFFVN